MSEKLFQSKQDEIKIVSLFILTRLSTASHEFATLVENFRQKHGYKKDAYFAKAMSNLFKGMINEWWIIVDDANESSKVTLTFKGKTVLRHTDEIDEFYARKFWKRRRVIQAVQPQSRIKVVAKTQSSKSKPNKASKKKAQKRKLGAEKPTFTTNTIITQSTSKVTYKGLKSSLITIQQKLPEFTNARLLGLWKNNVEQLSKKLTEHKEMHMAAIELVEDEWQRRIDKLSIEEAFKWPNTEVGDGKGGGDFERLDESFLKLLGYTVGKQNGLPASTRQIILDRCFMGKLPPLVSPTLVRSWGEPKSAARLKRIAYHLANLAKNFKKIETARYDTAIADWEEDLKYLHSTYYVGYFKFGWPR